MNGRQALMLLAVLGATGVSISDPPRQRLAPLEPPASPAPSDVPTRRKRRRRRRRK